MLKNDPKIGLNNLIRYNNIAKSGVLPFFKRFTGTPYSKILMGIEKSEKSLDIINTSLKRTVDISYYIREMLNDSETFDKDELVVYEWKEHAINFIDLIISKNIYSKINELSPIVYAGFSEDGFIFNVDVDFDGDLLEEVGKIIGPDLRFIDFDVIDWEIYIIPTERFINMYSSGLKSRY